MYARASQGALRSLQGLQAGARAKAAAEPADPPPVDVAAEADRFAQRHRRQAALIRRLGHAPDGVGHDALSPALVQAIVTGTSPNLRALDRMSRHVQGGSGVKSGPLSQLPRTETQVRLGAIVRTISAQYARRRRRAAGLFDAERAEVRREGQHGASRGARLPIVRIVLSLRGAQRRSEAISIVVPNWPEIASLRPQ